MESLGYAAGCLGRRAASRGTTAMYRTEECEKTFAEDLEKAGDEKLEKEKGRTARALAERGEQAEKEQNRRERESQHKENQQRHRAEKRDLKYREAEEESRWSRRR